MMLLETTGTTVQEPNGISASAEVSLPTVAAYDAHDDIFVADGYVPCPQICGLRGCPTDTTLLSYRVNGGRDCCRDCALEALCVAIDPDGADDVGTAALALALLEDAAPGSTPSAERPCAPVPNAKLIDLFEALKASLESAS